MRIRIKWQETRRGSRFVCQLRGIPKRYLRSRLLKRTDEQRKRGLYRLILFLIMKYGGDHMAKAIDLDSLLAGCADDSFDDGLRIDTELEPLGGPGGPVKPAVYEGGARTRWIGAGPRPTMRSQRQ